MNVVAVRSAILSDTAQWRSAAVRTDACAGVVADTTIPPHQFQGLWLPPVVEYGHLKDWFADLLRQAAAQSHGVAAALEEVLHELEDVDAEVMEQFVRLWIGRDRG
ncbi:hypothetical protein [Nocardioides hwasunensis]|uniref:MmyB-like transcription regulator ligand binding domain-containing protein n=1 Tax=Nocardioides hwasunensis TaxID=397258 RepID=A0ABR8MNG0_9ACTN|nr:hypothetical protein [Nocardioides hwasunensis]MBD3916335.1 hypothetical protein [Nocardioides hwasunensis]